jgi:Ca2+-binding EF-hand superfamily protein
MMACCYGIIDYRRFARMAASTDNDDLRKQYEQDSGSFALYSAQLLDTDLPWSTRAVIQLRRRWLGGSIFCALRGDPWLRSQRLFTVLVQVLLSMSMAALFFQAEDQLVGGACSKDVPGSETCHGNGPTDHPCCSEANGLLASLLTAACALPVIAAVNIAFGWMRRPLEADAMSKNGEQLARLQEAAEEKKHEQSSSSKEGGGNEMKKKIKHRRRDRCVRRVRRWAKDCSKCVRVQTRCITRCLQSCKRSRSGVAVHDENSDSSSSDSSSSSDYSMYNSSDSDEEAAITKRSSNKTLGSGVLNKSELGATKKPGTPPAVPEAPRQSAPVCARRKHVARQMRACAQTTDALFDKIDRDHSGTLSIDELRELMREVGGGVSVDEDDVKFVMQHAQRGSDDSGIIARSEMQQAISLWRYLQHERKFIADRFDGFDLDRNGRLDRKELKALMTSLNDNIECTDKEVAWVLKVGTSSTYARGGAGSSSLDADEVRGALALWYPALRKRRQLEELPVAARGGAGKMRRAAAAQMVRHRVQVEKLMQEDGCAKGVLGRSTLHRLLNVLNGAPVSDEAVAYVLALSDADHSDSIEPEEVVAAVTIWCTLHQQQDEIDASFDEFDVDRSGKLSREQVRAVLQKLNDGLPVTWTEVDWTIESADANGDGSLDRQELRAAVACWYLHVSTRVIIPTSGWRAMVPWAICGSVGLSCALLVASISTLWSVADTKAWLGTTLLSLVWKLIVFDPIKTLCCGSLLDPLYALICGEFEADALLESVEDVVETYTEEFTGAQLGGQAMDDISDAAQAATVAAGNNAVFAMGGIGAGKFQRQVAMSRVKRGIKIDMVQHTQDSADVDRRLGLQHTISHSRYADKINAKRRAAGLETTADWADRTNDRIRSAHQEQFSPERPAHEREHAQTAAVMIASARREQDSVNQALDDRAMKSRRKYAGLVASKRRGRMMSIGGFARSGGVHVDPLVDIMAVAKFIRLRDKKFAMASIEEDVQHLSTSVPMDEIRAATGAETPTAFGDIASGRLELPASIVAATAAPQNQWNARAHAAARLSMGMGIHGMGGRRSLSGSGSGSGRASLAAATSARNVIGMFGGDVGSGGGSVLRPLPAPPTPARAAPSTAASALNLVPPSLLVPPRPPGARAADPDPVDEFIAEEEEEEEEAGDLESASMEVWAEVEKELELDADTTTTIGGTRAKKSINI